MPTGRRVERRRSRARRLVPGRPRGWHVHWFRWVGDDPLGAAGIYRCRCGRARPGL